MIYKTNKLYISLLLLLSLFIVSINSSDKFSNIKLDGFLKLNDDNNYNNLKSNKLNQMYNQHHILDYISTSQDKHLKKVVQDNENKIVGIGYGYGLPISSGLLLNDQYVLTVSSIANDEHFNELSIRLGYQKTKAIHYQSLNYTTLMDYGQVIGIEGIVEVNNDIGYSILKLKNKTNHHHHGHHNKIKISKRIINDNELKALFNYEHNGPKKVAIVKSGDQFNLNNNIESGIYFDYNGNFIGLLDDNGNFINVRDIQLHSSSFKKLINNNDQDIKTEKRSRSHRHQNRFRSSKRPRYPGPNLPNPHTPPLARHHIIPYGLMEALWKLSSEYSKIKELFHVINKEPTLQYVVWSYWNIFSGPNPSLRYHKDELEKIFGEGTLGYDPEDSVEPLKPRSFNSKQWNIMQDLNKLLVSTYQHRSNIISHSKYSNEKIILESSLYDYQDKLEQIFNLLNENRFYLSKIGALHDYDVEDWMKLEKKYYLLS